MCPPFHRCFLGCFHGPGGPFCHPGNLPTPVTRPGPSPGDCGLRALRVRVLSRPDPGPPVPAPPWTLPCSPTGLFCHPGNPPPQSPDQDPVLGHPRWGWERPSGGRAAPGRCLRLSGERLPALVQESAARPLGAVERPVGAAAGRQCVRRHLECRFAGRRRAARAGLRAGQG